jgi:hypothetical protein
VQLALRSSSSLGSRHSDACVRACVIVRA